MRIQTTICIGGMLLSSLLSTVSGENVEVDFNRDVQPILSANCYACHGPDAEHREANLRLDTLAGVTESGAIVSGKPDESLLIERITSRHDDQRMPPVNSGRKLTADEVGLLRRWIAEGAKWEQHWAFVRAEKPAIPVVANEDWCRNELDYFALARLEATQLRPSAEADRAEQIRRVTLDLTGLLPTPEEVNAFVSDSSPNAYEKVVDRLLKSPRYGEHRARYWMDYVRYGDTQGIHVDAYQSRWPYRDYVIASFNNDKPYDQFTREQLAGDLLPPENVDQLVATGMIRCGIATGEGGTIIEELRVNLARERMEAFGAIYLGLTTGCAVCHDHKYDPLTQRDFYALSAFFNNIAEKASCDDRVDWPPNIRVPKAENLEAYNATLARRADVVRKLQARRAQVDTHLDKWLHRGKGPQPVSTADLELRLRLDENYKHDVAEQMLVHNTAPNAKPATLKTEGPPPHWGEETNLWPTFRLETNTRLNLGTAGDFEKDEPFSCGGWIKARNVPGGRYWNTKQGALIARMDLGDKNRGWNLYYLDGTLVVQLVHAWPNAISIKTVGTTEYRSPFRPPEGSHGGTNTTETLPRGSWAHVFFTYDGSGKAAGVKIYVNGQEQKVKLDLDQLTDSILTEAPTWLGRRHNGEPMQGTAYQDIRFYRRELSVEEVVRLQREDIAAEIVAKTGRAEWTLDEQEIMEDVFFNRYDPPSIALREQLPAIDAELLRLSAGGNLTLICREKTGLPYADVLQRGEFKLRKRRVLADVPSFLPPLPEGASHNRLDLADWVLSRGNPLTARVTVNRVWHELFGTGLVATSEDFGTVGERPSHPALLDWLAVDFLENGWQVKRLYKQIVMSSVYRQSARACKEALAADPENRLLSRGPRFRMHGEMIRDCALQASGLLVEKIGGPSVKPYQPQGVWENGSFGKVAYKQDQGTNLYRRSLYTYWKRMAPMPNMEAFDATDRSAACVRRQRTNTPMAALVLMNDPQFLESARQLATRVLVEGGHTDRERINYLGRTLRSRAFDDADQKTLQAALQRFRAKLSSAPSSAQALLSIGESPTREIVSLTTGKPSTSSVTIRGHEPGLANDGAISNTNRFWSVDASKSHPTWWQVDLLEPTDVGCVVVVGYYGDNRHYGFTVETSLDGRQWNVVADQRQNEQPSTKDGYVCQFERHKARFIRVDQTHNSANPGRHLVEVLAYRDTPPAVPTTATSTVEHAAWMLMASTIMNTDEVINK